MDPLLEFLRKGTEYGLSPPLLAVLAVVWLAWRFPAVRALLTRSVSGGNGATRYVTPEACHEAQDALGHHFDAAADSIKGEMQTGFQRVHDRIDKVSDRIDKYMDGG